MRAFAIACLLGAGCITDPRSGYLLCDLSRGDPGNRCPSGLVPSSDGGDCRCVTVGDLGGSGGGSNGGSSGGKECLDAGPPPTCPGCTALATACSFGNPCACSNGRSCLCPGTTGCTKDADCCGSDVAYHCQCGFCANDGTTCGLKGMTCCADGGCTKGTTCSGGPGNGVCY